MLFCLLVPDSVKYTVESFLTFTGVVNLVLGVVASSELCFLDLGCCGNGLRWK